MNCNDNNIIINEFSVPPDVVSVNSFSSVFSVNNKVGNVVITTGDLGLTDLVSTFDSNSANWQAAYSYLEVASGIEQNQQQATSFTLQNSSNVLQVNNLVLSNSSNWVDGNVAYTTLTQNSAAYLSAVDLSLINSTSANWQSIYSNVNLTSAKWQSDYSNNNKLSANWQSVYSDVNSTSSNWQSVYSDVNQASANWQSVYSDVNSYSGNWKDSYTNLTNLSTAYRSVTAVNGTIYQIQAVNDNNGNVALSIPNSFRTPGDLNVGGNLYVSGSGFQLTTSTLTVSSPIIYINDSLSGAGNIFDIGLVGHFKTDIYQHTGLVRSAQNNYWTLFSGLTTEPLSGPTLHYDDPTFTIDTLRANILGNLSGNNTSVNTASFANGAVTIDATGNLNSYASANFQSVSAISLSGVFFGDGSHLTGIDKGTTLFPYTSGSVTNSIKPVNGNNTASGAYSNVAGGNSNTASGDRSSILGGRNNNTNNQACSFIIGQGITASQPNFTYVNNLSSQGAVCGTFYGDGSQLIGASLPGQSTINTIVTSNSANWQSVYSDVNQASSNWQSVYSDVNSTSSNWQSVYNYISSTSATQAYTFTNSTSSINATTGGNVNKANYSAILGGIGNCICNTGNYSVILGGCNNTVSAQYGYINLAVCSKACGDATVYSPVVLNGFCNTASNTYAIVLNGKCNCATTPGSIVGVGFNNTACGAANSSVLGGGCNTASGRYSVVTGGYANIASGDYSFIASGAFNNTKGFANTFILGTVLSASQPNYTYVNNLSSQGLVAASGGNSTQWNTAYQTVSGGIVASLSLPQSANWNSVYSTVSANSASWQSVYSNVSTSSARWQSSYTTLTSNSARWQSVFSTVSANSANWQSDYFNNNSLSANWQSTYGTISTLSANWNNMANFYLNVTSNAISANYIFGGANETVFTDGSNLNGNGNGTLTLNYLSGIYVNSIINYNGYTSDNWNTTYQIVSGGIIASLNLPQSANWDSVYSNNNKLSANWQSVYSNTQTYSANWQNVYSQYTKMSSASTLSATNICGIGNETVFTDGTNLNGNGNGSLTMNYASGVYINTNLYLSSVKLPSKIYLYDALGVRWQISITTTGTLSTVKA